ncbi:MAG: hypothetical protein ACLFMU_02995, partial [Bacteroidales bacterium]
VCFISFECFVWVMNLVKEDNTITRALFSGRPLWGLLHFSRCAGITSFSPLRGINFVDPIRGEVHFFQQLHNRLMPYFSIPPDQLKSELLAGRGG